jgi:hypothetical protein
MDMKTHLLTALREQLEQWEDMLAILNESQLTTPLLPWHWSPKDVLAHLAAWQQISTARVEAALADREPQFPAWLPGLNPDAEETVDQLNALIYATHRDQPWATVQHNWRTGYLRLLATSQRVSERDLLDSGRYAWLEERPLVMVLLGTYDHHQEHYEALLAWVKGV